MHITTFGPRPNGQRHCRYHADEVVCAPAGRLKIGRRLKACPTFFTMDEAARRRILMEFTCNLCGKPNQCAAGELSREASSCTNCGSNVRTRGLLRALSLELFATSVVLPDFPSMKSLRGAGTSDTAQYAALLAEKFDYK